MLSRNVLHRVETPIGFLYRAPRPGRRFGPAEPVSDDTVRRWIDAVVVQLETDGALGAQREVDYVCLLGWRASGEREIADYYNARGPEDGQDAQTLAKPQWQAFLNALADGRLQFVVHHFPTTDGRPVREATITTAASRITASLERSRTVLVGCSAAIERTGVVLEHVL